MNKKTRNTLIILYVVAFLVTCIGATFAYFTILNTSAVSQSTEVEAATMTSIIFNAGESIALYATIDNFSEGMGSLDGATYASATLKNGTNSDSSTFYYDLSFELLENTLIYTTTEKIPEVVLTITDPDGNEIKDIEGLKYTTVNGVSGFDVTGVVGKFSIADKYEITTSGELTQKWDVKMTFVNLESSQDFNRGKGLSGVLKIDPIESGVNNG